MTLCVTESFDGPGIADLFTSLKWTARSTTLNNALVAGRNGLAWRCDNLGAVTGFLNIPVAGQDDLIVFGCARKLSPGYAGYEVFSFWGDANLTQHVTVIYNISTSLFTVYRGSTGGTSLGTISATLVGGTWYYLEFKIRLGDSTAGSVEIRVNGVVAGTISGVDTKNAGTATVFSGIKVSLNSLVSAGNIDYIDDMYVLNEQGSVNNDYLGDIKVETLIPNADGSNSAWTARNLNRIPVANTGTIDTDASGWAVDANCTISRVTTPVNQGAGALSITSVAGANMSIVSLSGTSGVPVQGGIGYQVGGYFRTAVTARTIFVGADWYDVAGTFISRTAPATTSASDSTSYAVKSLLITSPATAAYMAMVFQWQTPAAGSEIHYLDDVFVCEGASTTLNPGGVTTHYTAVNDLATTLPDLSYTVSQTDDAIDTWAHSNLASPSNLTVVGVMGYAYARTDTFSAKSLAFVGRRASSELASSDVALSQTFAMVAAPLPRPGGGDWTVTEINAAEFGVKVRP